MPPRSNRSSLTRKDYLRLATLAKQSAQQFRSKADRRFHEELAAEWERRADLEVDASDPNH